MGDFRLLGLERGPPGASYLRLGLRILFGPLHRARYSLHVLLGGGLLLFIKSPFGKRFLLEESDKLEAKELERDQRLSAVALEKASSAAYQARLKEVASEAENSIAALTGRLVPLQEQWANRLNELEANEEGRAIAADTASLGAYLQVAKAKPPERANTSSLLAKLEGIRDSAARLAVAPLLKEPPSLEQKAELDAITRKIQDAILTHESSLNELDTIARLAQSKGGSASQTLGEALDAERTRAEEERAEIYRLAFEKAEAETRRELERIASETAASIAQMKQQMAAREAADAKDHETRLAELEHAASRAKQSAVEAEAETARQLEAQRAQDASEKAALEGLKKRAQSSEVQDMLSPFITPDYYQLHGDVVTEKSPMSYQAMERAGAFVLGVPGLINLYEIALSERNSRPKGGWGTVAGTTGHFEMNYGEAAKRAYVAKVQQTLVELKPALLELKMMRP